MTYEAATYTEARKIAADLRRIYVGTDWVVTITAPLFDGDTYRINVG